MKKFDQTISIIGGAGHVGLPLSLLLASKGFNVIIIDNDKKKLNDIKKGKIPFKEKGASLLLKKLNQKKNLLLTDDLNQIIEGKYIIITLGTPIDEYLNPNLKHIFQISKKIKKIIVKNQILIFRSTLYPGTTDKIDYLLNNKSNNFIGVSNCPERITQGNAIHEIKKLPQIVSGNSKKVINEVSRVFLKICPEIIELNFLEAELTKLFNNAWRYLQFSIANQFYMISERNGIDFYKVHDAISRNYPRAIDIPKAGFTAGPCLFKDTMQLAVFNNSNFQLGYSAMLVNEQMPNFIIEQIKKKTNLISKKIGILGMAFKAESDDKRDSLAYKLRNELIYENAEVLCSDPFIKDNKFYSINEVVNKCDIIIIGCPHKVYKKIKFRKKTLVINCW